MVLPKLKSEDTQQFKFSCFKAYTINPLFSPPGGLFTSSPFEAGGGGLIETGGLFILEKDDGISSP